MEKMSIFNCEDFQGFACTNWRNLQNQSEFYDVTIACEDDQLGAHKLILSACSPVFDQLLKKNPHQHPLILLRGVKVSSLVHVIDFMYQGRVSIPQNHLNEFLCLMKDLKVTEDMKIIDSNRINHRSDKLNDVKNVENSLEKQKEKLLTDAKIDASEKNSLNEQVALSSKINNTSGAKIKKTDSTNENMEKNGDKLTRNNFNQTKEEKRIKCDICSIALISKPALNRHVRLSHNNILKYSCSTCGFQSAEQQNLKKHEETMHSDQRKFACDLCNKCFITNTKLQIHMESEHETEKFSIESNHNADQLVSCNFCEKGFNSNVSLHAHKRICQVLISQTVK